MHNIDENNQYFQNCYNIVVKLLSTFDRRMVYSNVSDGLKRT